MQKTLGGDRLGSGKRMKVDLHNYERSTHDLGYVWRSTMAAGTLVPFMSEIALPGDTFDINLSCETLTHPTEGPLFGSYKVQLDTFLCPIRLYNSLLHNNMLGIGMNMNTVKFPVIALTTVGDIEGTEDIDNSQINPSSLLSYLGIKGIGNPDGPTGRTRTFNAIPILAYWEIYKNYYANKQEELGAVLHTPSIEIITTVDAVEINGYTIPEAPATDLIEVTVASSLEIQYTGTTPKPEQIIFYTTKGEIIANELFLNKTFGIGLITMTLVQPNYLPIQITNWRYITEEEQGNGKPAIAVFPLDNIDTMRRELLSDSGVTGYEINGSALTPYTWLSENGFAGKPNILSSQEGLGLKTYQSDMFNNWLSTEWIDGAGGISEITSIDTSGGSFTIDSIVLARKVYNMLNRIAVSGGSYDDWIDAVYVHERYTRCESPIYCGGLSKELVFQEVINNSGSAEQPLGTLAGRGVMSNKHKGGSVTIKVDEPSYIIGLVSLTPRIDYSQGNKWDVHLKTMDDLHKPALDEIGFQDLITEQMAWWDTKHNGSTWVQKSAGKQPAWLNYMTNVNRAYGNFARKNNEMFMTLNRRYEFEADEIKDLTTYIDPSKYNNIFAESNLDAQNFWTQIGVDITARRKMSAKVMPNL